MSSIAINLINYLPWQQANDYNSIMAQDRMSQFGETRNRIEAHNERAKRLQERK